MDNKRVTFYVDGFNFYYELKRKKQVDRSWQRFYWIDVVKLFEQLFEGPTSKEIFIFARHLMKH